MTAELTGPRELAIPELSLVVLVGVTGSGKSTFARAHFRPTEVISSDYCRGLVADDENDQSATKDAFEVLHFIVGKRLAAGRLTVVDATNVQPEARRELVTLAREYDVLPVAIVLDLPERLCAERNASTARPRLRPARDPPAARPAPPRPARAPARGLPHRARAAQPGPDRRGHDHPHEAVQRPAPRIRPVRRHRRRARLPGRTGSAARPRSATRSSATPPAARSARSTRTGARSSSATSSTAARTPRVSSAWSWAWSRRAPR